MTSTTAKSTINSTTINPSPYRQYCPLAFNPGYNAQALIVATSADAPTSNALEQKFSSQVG
jgi:hypothetical protein